MHKLCWQAFVSHYNQYVVGLIIFVDKD